ncbi:MAG: hypothetical protein J0H62_10495, partial [Rhizobiales bacterium]|nr:hypothetical protein [Hyphomicrobiales bacterium]
MIDTPVIDTQAIDMEVIDTEDLHPVIPRVLCPECGSRMRLFRVDPAEDRARADTTTFACA